MKRKELFWMLVPCLILLVLAFVWRGRPGATLLINQPFAVVVEKVEKETLKPNEVADGWDTKLKITLRHQGLTPKWWGKPVEDSGSFEGVRFYYEDKGKQSAVKLSGHKNPFGNYLLWKPVWNEESGRYEARLLLPLAKVAPHPGSVKVQARLDFQKNNAPLCPPARLQYTARRPGEVVQVPQVSKNSHLRIEQTIIGDVPPSSAKTQSFPVDTRITWKVRYFDTGEKTTYMLGVQPELYDEKGNLYDSTRYGGARGVDKTNPISSAEADFDLKSIPRSAGVLTLRGKIGIGSYWPLEIAVPVRDKQGRILKTPQALAPFKIGSIEIRPASAETQKSDGVDTVISIGIQFIHPQKDVSYQKWQADWSPHLVDEKGKQFWNFKTPYPVGPQPIGFGTSYSAGYVHSIQYVLPLSQVPLSSKTLKFKTEIGFDYGKRVPLEILVRKAGVTQFTSQEPWP